MRLDETSATCRGLINNLKINNLKPRNVKVNYIYNYGNSSNSNKFNFLHTYDVRR